MHAYMHAPAPNPDGSQHDVPNTPPGSRTVPERTSKRAGTWAGLPRPSMCLFQPHLQRGGAGTRYIFPHLQLGNLAASAGLGKPAWRPTRQDVLGIANSGGQLYPGRANTYVADVNHARPLACLHALSVPALL